MPPSLTRGIFTKPLDRIDGQNPWREAWGMQKSTELQTTRA